MRYMTKKDFVAWTILLISPLFVPIALALVVLGKGIFAIREIILGISDGFKDLIQNLRNGEYT